jgi:osmotically inducible lipoprotein OsmB
VAIENVALELATSAPGRIVVLQSSAAYEHTIAPSLSLEENMISRTLAAAVTAVTLASALAGCGTPSRQTLGTVGGAGLGGLAGSAVTGGSTLGTLGGAAVGGAIGHEATRK